MFIWLFGLLVPLCVLIRSLAPLHNSRTCCAHILSLSNVKYIGGPAIEALTILAFAWCRWDRLPIWKLRVGNENANFLGKKRGEQLNCDEF